MDKFPVNTYCSSIRLYSIAKQYSTSEYFPIKGCALHFYVCVITCHNTWADMSAILSMPCHSDQNMRWNVFLVHTNVSIETKLFTCEIFTYCKVKVDSSLSA